MNGYTKLFGSIIASTIWRESKEIKVVWVTMLAMANKHGVVEASVPGLADMARVTVEEAKAAIAALEAPDTFSRTKEHEGRRIKAVDGGWLILNHAKYRAKMSLDDRREYNRRKQEEFRKNRKASPKPDVSTRCQQMSMTVNDSNPMSALSAHTDTDTDTKAGTIPSEKPSASRARNPLFDALAKACGSIPEQMTAPAARACGVALAAILKVSPGATPADLEERARIYRMLFRNAALTPSALCNHWAECATEPLSFETKGKAGWSA